MGVVVQVLVGLAGAAAVAVLLVQCLVQCLLILLVRPEGLSSAGHQLAYD